MRLTLPALMAAAISVGAPPCFAQTADIASRIEAVTVFPDGAMVTRRADVTLPQGASTLVIRGLPFVLDPASVRVEVMADGPLAIGAVETKLAPGDAKPTADPALEAKIAALREESGKLSARIDALEMKRKSILRFAEADPAKLAGDGKGLDATALKAAWDVVGEAAAGVNEDIRVEKAKLADLAAQIAALEKARPPQPRPGDPRRDVTVAVEAGQPVKGRLTLTYRVTQAGWQPRYDARLDTGGKGRKPALDIVRRAEVAQRTGEDWTDVALSVSTVRTAGGTAAPDVNPLIVSFDNPYPVPIGGQRPERCLLQHPVPPSRQLIRLGGRGN